MGKWLQDLKYSVRSLLGNKLYAGVAIMTLALGIGVNTAVFSLVSQIIFLDLPMENADELAWIWTVNQETASDITPLSLPNFQDIRERSRSFQSLSAMVQRTVILSGTDQPQRITVASATSNLLDVWGARTTIGRSFLPGEDQPGASPVAILTRSTWLNDFGGDPDALGRTIRLDDVEYTIVGVAEERMEVGNLGRASVWIPIVFSSSGEGREVREAMVTGRLRDGVSLDQAREEVASIGRDLALEFPGTNRGWVMQARTTSDSILGDQIKTIMLLLVLMVGLVLLISCANVANLVLVRSSARGREFAVRAALGAGRGRVVRQLLTENVVIALSAGLVGLGLAKALLVLLVRVSRGREVLFNIAELNGSVLAFTLVVSLLAPLFFGLLPALTSTRANLSSALREGSSRAGSGRRSNRVRDLLVSGQIAVALALMVLCGLAVRSAIALQQIDLGFKSEGLMTMVVDLPETRYDDDATVQFFEELLRRAQSLSAVGGVTFASSRPQPTQSSGTPFAIEGRLDADALDLPAAFTTVIMPNYFEVLEIPMLRGRSFEGTDAEGQLKVALVNRSAAERFWPGQDPIGQRIRMGIEEQGPWLQIVGVTEGTLAGNDINNLDGPQVFLPFAQSPRRAMAVLARTRGEPSALTAPIRQEVWALDPEQPIDDARSMDEFIYDFNSVSYALISLFIVFSVFALIMASMGIYGVMSYMVSRRSTEISVRMALGAERGDVLNMVMAQGGRLVVFGGVAGMVLAYLLSRLMEGLVYGISSTDPVSFIGVPVLLAVVAIAANYVPAFRATRIDPMTAMRTE
jgi:putative ABC transport system permease protein